MKRYAVHVSATVFVETDNVAQAAKHAKQCRLIGPYCGGGGKQRERWRITKGDLRFGRPIRLADSEGESRG